MRSVDVDQRQSLCLRAVCMRDQTKRSNPHYCIVLKRFLMKKKQRLYRQSYYKEYTPDKYRMFLRVYIRQSYKYILFLFSVHLQTQSA